MPLKLTRLAPRSVTVTVRTLDEQGEFLDEELTIKYRAITTAILNSWSDAKQKAEKAEQNGGGVKWQITDELADVLIDIDLVDEKNKPVKPTKDFLESIDIEIVQKIHGAIMDDVFPNAQT